MQFTTSDIQLADSFAKALSAACGEMHEGIPISQALAHQDVSPSTFATLIRGLRKSKESQLSDGSSRKSKENQITGGNDAAGCQSDNESTDDDIRILRHPSWQDDLVYDLCGDEYVYIPSDFDETLTDIEKEVLESAERTVIDSYYKDRKPVNEIASDLGIDKTTVRVKKNQALMKLREYVDDLAVGKDYLDHLDEMKRQYKRHRSELSWMKSAIQFMKDIDTEFDKEISGNDELSDYEKKFFTEHGVRRLRDLMHVDTSELLTEFIEAAEGYAASLVEKLPYQKKISDSGSVQQPDRYQVYPDTQLEEIGFSERTLEAFHRSGLYTAGDVFSLDEKMVRALTGIGEKQIIHLCWKALHGIEKEGYRDDEEDK